MFLKKFDLFASEFSFYLESNQQNRKKTWKGGLVSIMIIAVSLYYFIYLMQNYSQNKIDPKYKLQSFVSEDKIEYMLQNDYFGFDLAFTNGTLSNLEQQTGKQYLTFIPAFSVNVVGQQDPIFIMLDIIECQSEKLKGYKCIDFSKSQGYQLVLNDYANYTSKLMIVVYKCTDTDFFKQTVPNNCASDKEINDLVNNKNNQFVIKMKISQFNTTSEQMEERYKRYYTNLQTNIMEYTNQMSTKLQTDVKQGIFLQNTQTYSSIIDYSNQQERSYDREILKQQTNIYALLQLNIVLDEQIQYAQIQYVTILEVLSIFNSTFVILMGAGLLSRYFSKKIIYNQFQQSFLKEMFSHSCLQAQVLEDKKSKNKDEIQNCINYVKNFIQYLKHKQINQQNEIKPNQDTDKNQESICDVDDLDQQYAISNFQLQQMKSVQIDKLNKNLLLKPQVQLFSQSESPSKEIRKDLQQQSINSLQQPSFMSFNNLLHESQKKQDKTNIETKQNTEQDKLNLNLSNPLQKAQDDFKASTNQKIQVNNCIDLGQINSDFQSQSKQINQKLIQSLVDKVIKNNNIGKMKKHLKENEGVKLSEFKELFDKSLNIYDIYKDILFIKKAIMILLSVDQYAAIQMVGYQIGNLRSESSQLNHISQQIKQDNSQELLAQNLCKFFNKLSYLCESDKIDQRILNSLII